MSILDNVKSKLGFSGGKDDWDDRYDDGYDDYDDYGDDYDDYDDGYDEEPQNSRRTSSSHARSESLWPEDLSGGARRERRLEDTTPLVTNSDVRAKSYESYSSNRDEVPKVSSKPDYESSLQMYDIKPRETLGRTSNHSEESLEAARSELESLQKGIPVPLNSYSGQQSGSAQGGQKQPSTVSRRIVTIIPTSYEDAQKVSEAFRVGNSAVISLSAVPPKLACRILDFSFGAVSVSDGKVEKIGDKVFFLSHKGAAPISEAERQQLKDAGVL